MYASNKRVLFVTGNNRGSEIDRVADQLKEEKAKEVENTAENKQRHTQKWPKLKQF